MEKLKPVTFIKSENDFYRNNIFQQNVLLKALKHTSDLDELKKIAGFHSKVGVLKTLDKLSIRKEYHQALEHNGLSLDKIVKGIKELCDTNNEKVKLGALQTLLKSIGLDRYELTEAENTSWEDVIMNMENNTDTLKLEQKEYEVLTPEVPEGEEEKEEESRKIEQSIYE